MQTNSLPETPGMDVIIPPDITDRLRHLEPGYARLCVWCRSYLPPRDGRAVLWRLDGVCLRCYLQLATRLRPVAASSAPASPSALTPIGRAPRMSVAYLPDALADDTSMPLRVRVLIELQRRGAARTWTAPISMTDLASAFDRSRAAVSRAVAWAVTAGYLERQYAALPRGGRGARYRVRLERTQEAPQWAGN